jgi:hypothetical protein
MVFTNGYGFPLEGNGLPLEGNWFPLQGVYKNGELMYYLMLKIEVNAENKAEF